MGCGVQGMNVNHFTNLIMIFFFFFFLFSEFWSQFTITCFSQIYSSQLGKLRKEMLEL